MVGAETCNERNSVRRPIQMKKKNNVKSVKYFLKLLIFRSRIVQNGGERCAVEYDADGCQKFCKRDSNEHNIKWI